MEEYDSDFAREVGRRLAAMTPQELAANRQVPREPLEEKDARIYDLSAALLLLSIYYEGDTGGEHYMDRTRAYLSQFEIGRQVLQAGDEHTLRSSIFDREDER